MTFSPKQAVSATESSARNPARAAPRRTPVLVCSAAVALALLVPAPPAPAQVNGPPGNGSRNPGNSAAGATPAGADSNDPISLNFKDADIDVVVGAFGILLDRTFIIDPRVRGKITVETPGPVSREEAYTMLLASLRLQGFTVVTSGRLSRVVPEADAKLQSGPVTVSRKNAEKGDQIITQVFRLNYESATNLVPVLRPLIAPNNTISAYPNNNSLVITDYAGNLDRIARIIATLDSPGTREVEMLEVKHGVASDMAVMLTELLDDTQRAGQGAQVDSGQRIVVLADPSSNTILLRSSSPAKVNLARQLLRQLDRPTETPGNIHVVYLRNAEAVKLAETLQAALSGNAAGSGSQSSLLNRTNRATSQLANQQGGAQGGLGLNANRGIGGSSATGQQNQLGLGQQTGQNGSQQALSVIVGDAIIAADPTTNSLIITAPEAVYRNLRSVIDQLDTRRAQVYIESLIVEVNAQKAAEFGIQWQLLDIQNGSTRGVGGTNLTNLDGTGSILGATQNLATVSGGLNLGIVRGTTTIPGIEGQILNLPLLARALQTDAGANVLATPNLLTMDNEEARIIIGQNVPFITGQFSATGTGGASVNPFQTIERRDVGTSLSVKPQVSESGTVKMQIFQEVSSLQSSTASGPITNRRAIETNVLVDDGQIVVLGGLIEERIEGGVNKVPLLGDIPILGALFRYDSRKAVKTNLLVFLRPVVLRDARASYAITASRYDYMRQQRGDARLPNNAVLPEYSPTEMAPFPAPGNVGKTAPVEKGPSNRSEPDPLVVPPVPGYAQPPGSLSPDMNEFIEQRGGVPLGAPGSPGIDLRNPTPSLPGGGDVSPAGATESPSTGPSFPQATPNLVVPPAPASQPGIQMSPRTPGVELPPMQPGPMQQPSLQSPQSQQYAPPSQQYAPPSQQPGEPPLLDLRQSVTQPSPSAPLPPGREVRIQLPPRAPIYQQPGQSPASPAGTNDQGQGSGSTYVN